MCCRAFLFQKYNYLQQILLDEEKFSFAMINESTGEALCYACYQLFWQGQWTETMWKGWGSPFKHFGVLQYITYWLKGNT